ncbi:type III pantothenate kinase [Natranaerofaba carboxydovora]|uniref:type III pantothenate kinase n=1 Tax=Natranaerofaba carboxydovora TaxID=2742683 RepID=UPI001F141402|nr:type III pantothenate kinase [Natranaerofaba carboxydovora]UMZ75292.1 Type III pantothenate kinase [Natranaerofaba carboxydovora]
MLLAIDVGNTHTVLGVYKNKKLQSFWRIQTQREKTEDQYGITIKNLLWYSNLPNVEIKDIIISSVVPPLTQTLSRMGTKYFDVKPLVVSPDIKTEMNILYENPEEVGADRIVNAIAGFELYGGPLIIVDFGTATTFCSISEDGSYIGGAIAPGMYISTDALFKLAAKLPKVELTKPAKVIGRNTTASMQAGIFYGFVGQVDGIVKRMIKEFYTKPTVIATGGLANLISAESETIDRINPYLTLEGLKIIYEKNKR